LETLNLGTNYFVDLKFDNMRSLFALFGILSLMLLLPETSQAQVDARMLRYPDVSATHITFVYGGDIWVAPKTGGLASRLSSPKGQESFPRFSPDGSTIAFSGNYQGNTDVYTIPAMGGAPRRLTWHSMGDRVLDWTPDGNKVLFASGRESGRQRYSQFYQVDSEGGMAEKLPVPYGEFGSMSPDGKQFAYTDRSRVFRTWKRYRGGTAPDVYLFDMQSYQTTNITNNAANDELPMWHGNKIYYLSDQGSEKRFNLWVYDTENRQSRQLTRFEQADIHFPSIGPSDIVFEADGKLYLFDLATENYKKVEIDVVTDQMALLPKAEKVSNLIFSASIAPDGKRVVMEARGELFSLPAEHGYVKNLTNSSGIAERHPEWSPNGRYIAYWSDRSGEYELTIMDLKEKNQEKTLTQLGPGFRYTLYWSPDSEKLAFIDQAMDIYFYDMEADKATKVDKGLYMFEGGLRGFRVNWSADSRYMTYSRGLESGNNAIFIYDTEDMKRQQITSGYYDDTSPTFDPDGKYLYYLTNRHFSPLYSDYENSFVYPNATQVAALSLQESTPSPLAPRNDEVEIEDEEKEESKEEDKKDKGKKKGKQDKQEEEGEEDKEDQEKEEDSVKIDWEDMESRVVLLPMKPGNYYNLQAVKGKVLFHRAPNSGSESRDKPVMYFDLEQREEKTIIGEADGFSIAAKGKKMLLIDNGSYAVVNIAEGQKMKDKLPTGDMEMMVNPKEEWKQIFSDAWRFERDFFYDPNMHGVDWEAMRTRYGDLIEDAVTRWDVNYVIGELIGELNASHTYRYGGDTENASRRDVGYLGVNWKVDNGHYQIGQIVRGAPWDAEARSPLDLPGVDVKEGDYILAVNGMPLTIEKEPYAGFEGLAGKTVALTVSRTLDPDSARTVVVETMGSETRLRHLAWIEVNRKRVEEASNGRIGYVYVRSTGIDGQNELVRQFYPQYTKEGLIVDERFNSGGQIPDRFIELLNREPLAYWAVRDGKNWQWPPVGHFGPKAMLINGWSGSGGDAFPDYFRKAELGPLIGSRTWGGLIGISGAPSLIDGGGVTVPTFRMYDPDGDWFKEGHGVDPDIEVWEDPGQLAKGIDPQLERAIQEIMKKLDDKPGNEVPQPDYEER
jgi:tricorn protease